MSWAFFAVSAVGAAFTWNAFFPVKRMALFHIPSFFGSWLTNELAGQHLVWQAAATALFLREGALEAWPGWAGLALTLASWAGLLALFVRGRATGAVFDEVLGEHREPGPAPRFPRLNVALGFLFRQAGMKVRRNVVFRRVAGRALRLDVFEPAAKPAPGERRPVVLQLHGGGWIIGDKREQGLPLLCHLARNGWVGINANYRLSPSATFPDHLDDVKAAIAWIRAHAGELHADPSFIAVTGGSAGAHLTALAALTPNDPRFQPGFEDADTTVQAAVPFYGVYDFTNRAGRQNPGMRRFVLEPWVMKAFYEDEPEKFALASPLDHVGPHAPPFLVIHGDRDTLAPVEDARDFVAALREVSSAPVVYAELPNAQHAFDVFNSPRTARAVMAVERFLAAALRRHRSSAEKPAEPAVEAPLAAE